MEYFFSLLIFLFAVYLILNRLKSQNKCSKCAENNSCYIRLKDCNLEDMYKLKDKEDSYERK